MSDIFDLAKRLSGEEEVEQATSFAGQIISIFFIIMAALVLFFFFRYVFGSKKNIIKTVDPSEEEGLTAQEYNKKADAQMEAIRSGRSDYKETSAKSITKTKGILASKHPYGRTGKLYFVMVAIVLVIGLVIGFENITGQGILLTLLMSTVYPQLYFMLGHVGKDAFIEKGWYKKNASIFQEILMSPIFIIFGVVFISGLGLILGVGGALVAIILYLIFGLNVDFNYF